MAPRARKPKKASPSTSTLESRASASSRDTVDFPAPGGPVTTRSDAITRADRGRGWRPTRRHRSGPETRTARPSPNHDGDAGEPRRKAPAIMGAVRRGCGGAGRGIDKGTGHGSPIEGGGDMATNVNDKLISWASDIDPGTIRQAEKTARLPIVAGHVALMPDAHVGIGATVGSVIPTTGAVIPSAVGVDIGCGMIAAELDVTEAQLPDTLEPLLGRIEAAIPAGVGKGHDDVGRNADKWLSTHRPATKLSSDRSVKAAKQFGTLGSGNHFFELCVDERTRVWVVLHSGSRGIGNQLAQMHIATARRLAKALQLHLEDPDLAYFTQGTAEFEAYIADMLWAQDYARANRDQMMDNAMREVFAFIGFGRETQRINCHHNFTQRELHDGRELW